MKWVGSGEERMKVRTCYPKIACECFNTDTRAAVKLMNVCALGICRTHIKDSPWKLEAGLLHGNRC